MKKAFTLIEIMIVIGILSVLMIALLVSMTGQRDKAEDAKVKSDLERLKIAFEDYYNDNNCYPPATWFDSPNDCGSTSLSPYLASIPCDKRTGEPYKLVYPTSQCSSFRLYASLDKPDTSLCSSTGTGPGNYGVSSSNETVDPKCDVVNGGVPLPSTVPGKNACRAFACQDYGTQANAIAAGCPVTFSADDCQGQCGNSSIQCP